MSPVTVQNVQPSRASKSGVLDDAVKAGQDQGCQSEGQAYANDIPRAKGTAARLIQEAEGYKARVVATAEGDAAQALNKCLLSMRKSAWCNTDRMYIDSMREMYSNKHQSFGRHYQNNTHLQADKLLSASAESAQVANRQAPATTPTGSVTVGGQQVILPHQSQVLLVLLPRALDLEIPVINVMAYVAVIGRQDNEC